MKTITIETYQFDELSEQAKEKARQWWRDLETQDSSFSESVYEDVSVIADLFGLAINTRKNITVAKKVIYSANIYYSGFWSQGDGACFEGKYSYKKGALKAVREYAPKESELHSIVQDLQTIQRQNFYQLTASAYHSGYYYHSGCMRVEVDREDEKYLTDKAEDEITRCLRLFADWIYKCLENEYKYIMANENVDESIRINKYDFTIEGERI